MMDDLQHEEILNNFDQFIKMAGSELLTLKDVARNITGWTDIDQRPSFHISYFIFLFNYKARDNTNNKSQFTM